MFIIGIILGVLALAIVALLLMASMKPDTFSLERSVIIEAPAERIFGLIDDFRQWEGWSPWAKIDPAMKTVFAGPATGPGSSYAWEGNNKVGKGEMEITASSSPTQVTLRLHFIKPFEATNTTEFIIEPAASGHRVRWKMSGAQPFTSKMFAVVVDMDKMIGRDFDKGLAAMKALAESRS
jgi:hypothetical protein